MNFKNNLLNANSNFAAYLLIIAGVYYLIAEFISAVFFNDSIVNTYLFHTISELGIPHHSPLSFLMNSAFIFIGLALIFTAFTAFKHYFDNIYLMYALSLITGVGVIMVGLIHAGDPITFSYHSLGATMAIVGGNILLIVSKYKSGLILGIFGLISFGILLILAGQPVRAVPERLSVYTLIIWCFIMARTIIRD